MRLIVWSERASGGGGGESQLTAFVQASYWHAGVLVGLILLRLACVADGPHERSMANILGREVMLALGMGALLLLVVVVTSVVYG